jgi:hypothetical protein
MLSNDDVRWAGTLFGLSPRLTGEAAALLEMGEGALPALIEALSDPRRYVGAHVALTGLSGVEHESFPTWNGLAVVLAADGSLSIDPAQRPVLIERWRRWYQTRPHPDTLPSAG